MFLFFLVLLLSYKYVYIEKVKKTIYFFKKLDYVFFFMYFFPTSINSRTRLYMFF